MRAKMLKPKDSRWRQSATDSCPQPGDFPLGSPESRAAAREIDQLNTRYQRLTPREREVFALVSAGLLNKQVAAELGAAEKTIKQHRGRVMRKMQAESLAELVVMAQRLGVRGAGDFAEAKGRISRA